jgi:ribosomal protein S18 acetylase RimI-like enzyme
MIEIGRANPIVDSKQISDLLRICNEEGVTLVDSLAPEEELGYLSGLGPREAVHVAYENDDFVGFQSSSEYGSYSSKLRHVAQVGTWVMPGFRRRGIGRLMWKEGTLPWLKENDFLKVVITVIMDNTPAVVFYESLGFAICGKLMKHVHFTGKHEGYSDEYIMELWL